MKMILEKMEIYNHEQLVFCNNRDTGLRAVIAIHNTILGPALGGCYLVKFKNIEEAVSSALQFSRKITFSSAILGTNLGGAKIILLEPADGVEDKETYYRVLGKFVQSFKGRLIACADVGTTTEDMVFLSKETEYTAGLPEMLGGSGESNVYTALGVLHGIKACVAEIYGSSTLEGLSVCLQGLGRVGYILADYLIQEKANLIITDLIYDRIKKVKDLHKDVKVIYPEEILNYPCDIFAPCALGRVIRKEDIPRLRCKIIAGSATAPLEKEALVDDLHQHGILYAPDFIINSAELIQATNELRRLPKEKIFKDLSIIYDILSDLVWQSKQQNIPPYHLAKDYALKRIKKVALTKKIYQGV